MASMLIQKDIEGFEIANRDQKKKLGDFGRRLGSVRGSDRKFVCRRCGCNSGGSEDEDEVKDSMQETKPSERSNNAVIL